MHVAVFPGQGVQFKGMGGKPFKRFPEETNRASDMLGYDIWELCLEDPHGQLYLTQYTQLALYLVNALAWLHRRSSFTEVSYLMGHSLGEYNALYAAGAFDLGTGLELVKERGRLMATAAGGGMLAVLGMLVGQLQDLIEKNELPTIEIANYNTATQLVLSGDKGQIDRAFTLLEEQGVKAIPLNVSAALHSSYVKATSREFEKFLRKYELDPFKIPMIADVDARPYRSGRIVNNLAQQIPSPVLRNEGVHCLMAKDRQFTFTEINERVPIDQDDQGRSDKRTTTETNGRTK